MINYFSKCYENRNIYAVQAVVIPIAITFKWVYLEAGICEKTKP